MAEIKYDTDPLVSGTYIGANGSLSIFKSDADFKSCGVLVGLAIRNITDGSEGVITAVTETDIIATLTGGIHNSFYNLDEYEIYMTPVYNSLVSIIYTDRRYGHKVVNPSELENGIKSNELDLDENTRNVFGPGQPMSDPRGY